MFSLNSLLCTRERILPAHRERGGRVTHTRVVCECVLNSNKLTRATTVSCSCVCTEDGGGASGTSTFLVKDTYANRSLPG